MYRKKRLRLFMMQIQKQRRRSCLGKVKSGQVRFLIGSTAKMGAGTNVQDRLIALHHLDIGWKPSDLGTEGRDVLSVREIIIKRFISSGM